MLHNTDTKHSVYSSKATDTLEGCSQETGHHKLNGNSVFIAAADQTRILIIWLFIEMMVFLMLKIYIWHENNLNWTQ